MGRIRSILFVCTGNSCRSVMAEGLLRKYLVDAGRDDIDVSSAGTRAPEGFHPTDETIEVMAIEGIDVSGAFSRTLTDKMIEESDLILVMEHNHRHEVLRRVPAAKDKTYLLREYKNPKRSDDGLYEPVIPDPIGSSIEGYETCLGIIKKEILRILKII